MSKLWFCKHAPRITTSVLWCVRGRVLFEVASLEREAALPHEACLRHLAASVRTCHKIHDFAGGFEQDQSELFDKASLHFSRLHMFFSCANSGSCLGMLGGV